MSTFTQFNPGTVLEIRQIHNKAQATENKIYWGRAADGSVHKYRGTHEGRLKDETELIQAEDDILVNDAGIKSNKGEIDNNAEDIKALDEKKADKCYALAMSIIL
jgi:hypothetical protein